VHVNALLRYWTHCRLPVVTGLPQPRHCGYLSITLLLSLATSLLRALYLPRALVVHGSSAR
jgi:hypothetical protein